MSERGYYIVVNADRGPALWPHRHPLFVEAKEEAKRLARLNPGQHFIVFRSIANYARNDILESEMTPQDVHDLGDEIPF